MVNKCNEIGHFRGFLFQTRKRKDKWVQMSHDVVIVTMTMSPSSPPLPSSHVRLHSALRSIPSSVRDNVYSKTNTYFQALAKSFDGFIQLNKLLDISIYHNIDIYIINTTCFMPV